MTTAWPWPQAWEEPGWLGDGSYVDLHPTRYNWRSDVEEVARYLVDNYDCWCNTYVYHPPSGPFPGQDTVSMDVWSPAGRGSPIDPGIGQAVFDDIYHNASWSPAIWWVIWWWDMWSIGGGWEAAPWGPPDSDPGHTEHVHFTFV